MKSINNIKPLTSTELIQIDGGTEWWEVALVLASPAAGFFYFGIKHGYQDRGESRR